MVTIHIANLESHATLSVYNDRAWISVGNFDECHIVAFIDRRS